MPAITAWLAVVALSPYFAEAGGAARIAVWVLQALAVSLVASWVAGLAVKRLAPLPGLLSLTLVFPDEAPSRFGVALRAGSTRKLREQVVSLPDDEGQAARQALELVVAMNGHDRLTRGHMERVRAHSEVIGKEMGLSERDLNGLRWGSLLHDAGKLRVPVEILQKEGKPTAAEWEILRQHPSYGVEILAPLADFLGPWMGAATDHHERWDGSGYPAGKSGTEISLAGRICSVADAYDVITSRRSYKEKQGVDVARAELVRCAGDQFDPAVVRAFLNAGVRTERRAGVFGWLFELPQLWTTVAGVPAAVTTGVVAATTVTAATFAAAPVETPPLPPAVAFAFEDAESSTTTQLELLAGDGDGSAGAQAPTTVAPIDLGLDTTTTSLPKATTSTSSTIASTTSIDAATSTTTSLVVDGSPSTTRPTVTTQTTTSTTAAPRTTTSTAAPTTTTTTAPRQTTTTSAQQTSPSTVPRLPAIPTIAQPVTGAPEAQIRSFFGTNSLAVGDFESQTLSVFVEGGPVVLGELVEILAYGNSHLSPTIDAGDTVCTYILHHDPATEGLRNAVVTDIDFHAPILGFTIPGRTLPSPFDRDGVDYGDRNALELNDFGNSDIVQVEGSMLSLTSKVGMSVDRVRVLTAC